MSRDYQSQLLPPGRCARSSAGTETDSDGTITSGTGSTPVHQLNTAAPETQEGLYHLMPVYGLVNKAEHSIP